MKNCKLDNCEAEHYGKGYCHRHWRQIHEHGCITDASPTIIGHSRLDPNEFVVDGCALKIGLRDNRGIIVRWAMVSLEDEEIVRRYRWGWDGDYVGTQVKQADDSFKRVKLHKLLFPNIMVDHKNRDTLDNLRENLRPCTKAENNRNRGMLKNNTTGYRGVQKIPSGFRAVIRHKRKLYHLGVFSEPENAALAYNKAAVDYHGKFAVLNIF